MARTPAMIPKVLVSLADRIYRAQKRPGRTPYSRESAMAAATAALQASGHLRKGTLRLTGKGQAWRPKGPRKKRK